MLYQNIFVIQSSVCYFGRDLLSFFNVLRYTVYFFSNYGCISVVSITITKNSLFSELLFFFIHSELLDMTVHVQVNAHHKHTSLASNFSAKLCKTHFEINKLNLSCIGYCKFP